MTVTCPHCHSEYEPPQLDVDWTHNAVIVDGVAHGLRGQLLEIFSILLDGYPRVVSYVHMAARLWGGTDGPENEISAMRAQLSNLRTALRGIGWTILNTWGVGYRLTEVAA